jgi:hypothetical protein
MSKYGHKPLDWFEALVNKLGGEAEANAFLRGELVIAGKKPPELLPWARVTLGLYKNPTICREALKEAFLKTSGHADELLDMIPFSQREVELDLCAIDFKAAGFSNRPKRWELQAVGLSWGLELCPAEVGPALLIQGPQKIWWSSNYEVVMDPLKKKRFNIYRGYELSTWGAASDEEVDSPAIFVRPRKP